MQLDLGDPVAVMLAAAGALERAGLEATAYGGLVLAMYGRPRETRDADLAIASVSVCPIRKAVRARRSRSPCRRRASRSSSVDAVTTATTSVASMMTVGSSRASGVPRLPGRKGRLRAEDWSRFAPGNYSGGVC